MHINSLMPDVFMLDTNNNVMEIALKSITIITIIKYWHVLSHFHATYYPIVAAGSDWLLPWEILTLGLDYWKLVLELLINILLVLALCFWFCQHCWQVRIVEGRGRMRGRGRVRLPVTMVLIPNFNGWSLKPIIPHWTDLFQCPFPIGIGVRLSSHTPPVIDSLACGLPLGCRSVAMLITPVPRSSFCGYPGRRPATIPLPLPHPSHNMQLKSDDGCRSI